MRPALALLSVLILAACAEPVGTGAPSRDGGAAVRFGDADPADWAGPGPWTYPVHGIDVSRYQGEIDWSRIGAADISFAFLKATEGGDRLDARFAANWEGARRAGVPRGAYHFFYLCRPGIEQARWFAAHVPRDRAALPPVLDLEWNPRSPTCRRRPAPERVREEARAFLQEVARHYGRRPIIYSSLDFFRDNELWRLRGYDFWLRSVASHPSVTYPEQSWLFWQYTGTGLVSGISGVTDINVFSGSRAEWRRWLASARR